MLVAFSSPRTALTASFSPLVFLATRLHANAPLLPPCSRPRSGAGADENLIREGCPADPKFEEFAAMQHGWVIKGDLAVPEVAEAVPKAVGLISGWLNEHLR